MPYPPFLKYRSQEEYRRHFQRVYCRVPLRTFDGVSVRFRKRDFDHAFFESIRSKDDTFSLIRAERMDWIKTALEDPASELYIGWDNKRKRYDRKRRVAVVMGNYIVVIALTDKGQGHFRTAFVADSEKTLTKIRSGSKWA